MKQHINTKKGSLGRANSVRLEDMHEPYPKQTFSMSKMDTYLDNLAAAITQEKDVLE